MVRWVLLAVAVMILSTVATVALQFIPTSSTSHDEPPAYPTAGKTDGPEPKAEVDGALTHNFGTMSQRNKGRKTWNVKNVGPGDLHLKKGPSTCSCTIASLKEGEEATLKTGESTEIVLEWETRENNGKYEKSASIVTDDPQQPKLDFVVTGTVRPAVMIYPPDGVISFLEVSNDEGGTNKIALTSPDKPDMKVTKIVSSKPDFIETKLRDLTAEEKKALSAEGGYAVDVVLKKGMPIGAFSEELVVSTDHPLQSEIKLRVVGKSVGPITVVPERLRMLNVSSKNGGTAEMTIWVRGREETTTFTVAQAPKGLKIAVVPGGNPTKGATMYRMTVQVAPGTPSGTIEDQIVLKTDHPMAGEVKIPVNIFLTGGN